MARNVQYQCRRVGLPKHRRVPGRPVDERLNRRVSANATFESPGWTSSFALCGGQTQIGPYSTVERATIAKSRARSASARFLPASYCVMIMLVRPGRDPHMLVLSRFGRPELVTICTKVHVPPTFRAVSITSIGVLSSRSSDLHRQARGGPHRFTPGGAICKYTIAPITIFSPLLLHISRCHPDCQ